MEVIVIDSEAYRKMLKELTDRTMQSCEDYFKQKKSEWMDATEAKKLLGIKSKAKLQQLRDTMQIEFSQFGKIIRYSRKSILDFLERHRVKKR